MLDHIEIGVCMCSLRASSYNNFITYEGSDSQYSCSSIQSVCVCVLVRAYVCMCTLKPTVSIQGEHKHVVIHERT